ncbi:MAG: hypothetical protein DRH50_13495 [Deltaproteobacteria bacterium]|nr:MAG: hypothetical protein DRH50_13495 [Deltaproteobacteria bacterium]
MPLQLFQDVTHDNFPLCNFTVKDQPNDKIHQTHETDQTDEIDAPDEPDHFSLVFFSVIFILSIKRSTDEQHPMRAVSHARKIPA